MTTIVFPGQGSQFIGMSKDFYYNFSIAKDVFDQISETTKINLKDIIFNNPSDLLNQTQYTQLSIYCASMSIFNVLVSEIDKERIDISYMLGHSLGEYTALTAAGIIAIEDCSNLLKIRGELMQNAYKPNESGMAAIIGLNSEKVEEIIKNNNLKIQVANDNSPFQVVVSGIKKELESSEIFFKNSGSKRYVLLNVSAAFHSTIMIDAEIKMSSYIKKINFLNSDISIISNFTGNISNNSQVLIENLCKQMSNKVRWVESITSLKTAKETKILEIGPGKVLTGLIKRINKDFNILNLEKITDIEKITNEF